MLLIASLLHDWCRSLRCIYYILCFATEEFRDYNLFIRRSRVFCTNNHPMLDICWYTGFYFGAYNAFLWFTLKFLRRFVDFSRIHVISGYIQVSIFVLVFLLTIILLTYLLTGLRSEYDLCVSACRPLFNLDTFI